MLSVYAVDTPGKTLALREQPNKILSRYQTHGVVAKYMATNYDEIKIRVPKGRRADFDAYAKEQGESVNGLVNRFMRDSLGMSEEEWKAIADDDTRGT